MILGATADPAHAATDPPAATPDSTRALADSIAAATEPTITARSRFLRVFLDCQPCDNSDLEYLRKDIPFVDHVRDRSDAQVHILITSVSTGGGGDAYTMTFIGREAFASLDDTLRYDSRPAEAIAVTRAAVAQRLKLGLLRFVARTATAPDIGIRYTREGSAGGAEKPPVDRWNNWVLRTGVDVYLNGQTSYSNRSVYFTQSASRITLESKLGFKVNGSYNESRYDIGNGTEIVRIQRSRGGSARYVRSLGAHWSAALSASVWPEYW